MSPQGKEQRKCFLVGPGLLADKAALLKTSSALARENQTPVDALQSCRRGLFRALAPVGEANKVTELNYELVLSIFQVKVNDSLKK